jgi:hypothetical protein
MRSFFSSPFVLFLLVAFLTFFSCCFGFCCLVLVLLIRVVVYCLVLVLLLHVGAAFLHWLLFHQGAIFLHWCYCCFMLALMLLCSIGVVILSVHATPLRINVASSCWCYHFVHWCGCFTHWCYFQVPSSQNTIVVVFTWWYSCSFN